MKKIYILLAISLPFLIAASQYGIEITGVGTLSKLGDPTENKTIDLDTYDLKFNIDTGSFQICDDTGTDCISFGGGYLNGVYDLSTVDGLASDGVTAVNEYGGTIDRFVLDSGATGTFGQAMLIDTDGELIDASGSLRCDGLLADPTEGILAVAGSKLCKEDWNWTSPGVSIYLADTTANEGLTETSGNQEIGVTCFDHDDTATASCINVTLAGAGEASTAGDCDVSQHAETGASNSAIHVAQYSNSMYRAMPFVYQGSAAQICKINLWLDYNINGGAGSSHNYYARLYSDSSGEPGSAIGTSSAVDLSGIGSIEDKISFVLPTPSSSLSNGTTYWIAFYSEDDLTGFAEWHSTQTESGISSTLWTGEARYSSDGTTWYTYALTDATYKFELVSE